MLSILFTSENDQRGNSVENFSHKETNLVSQRPTAVQLLSPTPDGLLHTDHTSPAHNLHRAIKAIKFSSYSRYC